jgi:hypothetical protein
MLHYMTLERLKILTLAAAVTTSIGPQPPQQPETPIWPLSLDAAR